ncbi:MAG: MFS transporter [Heyndrickxia faecalis]|jgi:CP family cyanate transporter-like MFS transporter|uniref:Major facilitator superfamily MFS_1 n=4 Tax=Heyndrickxia TaxID=2837504 RepID=G2TL78_HEYCO|nr:MULTISPECIES: MFS transporter [Heyndrickxia]AEP02388.1 major facilitator superfamily MFS_1 [Heyndrickxia coagulans 36D1]AVD56023.1 MFS transporter [Heyndrickxia coagulans]AWP36921.1 MFS transporter [Heyndrickxia coagulans]KGT39292.1 transporter [Heyndrickxia coagulans P38]KWZ76835.1 transporter, major facilitator family protein [Heyndrickxia coagulans]
MGDQKEKEKVLSGLLVAGVICIAANLRPAITSIGPVIGTIRHSLHMSNAQAGFITTLPLLAFALISPLAPKLASRIGQELTLLLGIVILFIGILARTAGNAAMLYIGTAFIGTGIAIGNVLLPSLIKHRVPAKLGLMTSIYTTVMGGFAALASGVSVPIVNGLGLGWKWGLLVWGILSILAALVWIPQLREHAKVKFSTHQETPGRSVWLSSLAWQVTLFLGLQSFLFYSTIAWLAEIMVSHGASLVAAGWMVSIMQFVSLPATFMTPIWAERMKNQIPLVFGITIFYLCGLTGLLYGGHMLWMWICIILIGIAQGASISLALAFIGLRSKTATEAANLSGMSQSAGYLVAAAGPFLIGWLYDRAHNWHMPVVVMIICGILMLAAGAGAGRNKYVSK